MVSTSNEIKPDDIKTSFRICGIVLDKDDDKHSDNDSSSDDLWNTDFLDDNENDENN